jgi:hypothetical protein
MYNSLNDAKSAVNHGVEAAAEAAEHAVDATKKGVASAKTAAEHSAASVFATVLKGVSAAVSIVIMLRRLDLDDGLSWFGLERRRSPLSTIAIFGAGIVVGTGVGLLFAPVSGAEARRAIADAIHRGEAEIEDLEHKAEELAGKAEAKVKKAVGIQERPNGTSMPAPTRT